MQETDNWSKSWKSSRKPTKQRKYRDNAPKHVKDKLVSINVSKELREELGTRSIPVRTGDRVRVMRGDEKGSEGIVSTVDRETQKIYVNDITVERQNGTESEIPLRPSNLQIQALNVDDNVRLEKYDISDVEQIGVEEEEMEEALEEDEESEMMQKMQAGQGEEEITTEEEETEEAEEPEEPEDTEEEETETTGADYDDIVGGTISDAKDELNDMENPDYEAALEAEKNNKNRTTFIDWLENKTE
jgi:large subunit ribosomal protein L24